MIVKYTLSTVLLVVIAASMAIAQSGTIKGSLQDAPGNPLEYATIGLKGTTKGATTDENGNYEIKNVAAGKYTIIASSVGYEPQRKIISLQEGETKVVDFTLEEGVQTLQTVEITGRKLKSYRNDVSYAATKTATNIKDVPQAISYVTKEVMEDRHAYRVNDVVKNISGVNQFSWYNDYTIRGFRSQQELINGKRAIGLFGPQIITANLERVEVIKGPASALFGNASPGGTVNRVTKKPLENSRKAINFTIGSFNTLRSTMDFTGPLNESKTLLYRLNLAYENSNNFRDLQEFKSYMIAPSISFLPSEKTHINFDLVITNFDGKLDRGQPIFGASAGTDLNSTPISFAIGTSNDYHTTNVAYGTLSLNHQFTDNFSFNASFMRYGFEEDLFEHRTSNRFAVDSLGNEIPTLMGMRISAREKEQITDNLTSYFVWEGQSGNVSHKVLAGYDFIQSVVPPGSAGLWTPSSSYRTVDGGEAPYDPDNSSQYIFDQDGNPVPNIPHFNLQNPSYNFGFPSDYILNRFEYTPSRYYTQGLYIQDQIRWKKLQVLLGVRQEFYTDLQNYKQSDEEKVQQEKFLPRIGVVYSLNDAVNLYGTYTESFQPQNPSDLTPDQGGPFDPLTGQMLEAGVKGTFFNNRLAVNIAGFMIENKNILITDVNTGLLAQRGAEESNGVELDVNGQITNDFSVTANYAYNEAKITQSDDEAEIGRTKENAPKHAGGFFANYHIPKGVLEGLNVNVGANFVTERNTFDRALQLPGYNVWDAGMSYKINNVKLALTVNNILDKTHWIGGYSYKRLFPGAPRNFMLSAAYNF